jgi:hypothetical protein
MSSKHPSRSQQGFTGLPSEVADCARLGSRLSRTPLTERDLRWHILAHHVGDLGALASARLRVPSVPGAGG